MHRLYAIELHANHTVLCTLLLFELWVIWRWAELTAFAKCSCSLLWSSLTLSSGTEFSHRILEQNSQNSSAQSSGSDSGLQSSLTESPSRASEWQAEFCDKSSCSYSTEPHYDVAHYEEALPAKAFDEPICMWMVWKWCTRSWWTH